MTVENGQTSANVSIGTTGVDLGVYNLVLESYDTAAPSKTLKTDIITFYVTEYVRSPAITNSIVILKGASQSFSVNHLVSTITLPTTQTIHLRQTSASLSFVTIENS